MKRFFVATFTIIALLATYSMFTAPHRSNTAKAQGQAEIPEPAQDAPGRIKHELNPHGADNVTAGGTGSLSTISYHGGPLIGTPTAYIIWYGNWNRGNGTDTPQGQAIVEDFLSNLG